MTKAFKARRLAHVAFVVLFKKTACCAIANDFSGKIRTVFAKAIGKMAFRVKIRLLNVLEVEKTEFFS